MDDVWSIRSPKSPQTPSEPRTAVAETKSTKQWRRPSLGWILLDLSLVRHCNGVIAVGRIDRQDKKKLPNPGRRPAIVLERQMVSG